MQNLEKRLSVLEKAQPPVKGLTINRRFIAPGRLGAEIDHISDHNGKEWTRQPEEPEAAFTARAVSETAANAWGIKKLQGKTLAYLAQNPPIDENANVLETIFARLH